MSYLICPQCTDSCGVLMENDATDHRTAHGRHTCPNCGYSEVR